MKKFLKKNTKNLSMVYSKAILKDKKNKGITLVALVVTIIVLLILAGVSLSLIAGGNGILSKASNAADQNKIATAKEQVELKLAEFGTDFYQEKYVEKTNDGTKKEYIAEQLQNGTYTKDYYVEASEGDIVRVHESSDKLGDVVFLTGTLQSDGSILWDDSSLGGSGENLPTCSVTVKAPKNSVITLKSGETKINSIEMNAVEEKTIPNVNINQGNTVIAICKINETEIYRKEFTVQENNTINLYPCSENGDGKAIYWYGMEFTDLTPSGVSYNNIVFTSSTDGVDKLDNDMLLRMNDNDYSIAHGIGVYFNEDLSNYEEIQINISSVEYTRIAVAEFFVGDVPCNYYYEDVRWAEDSKYSVIQQGRKILNVSDIKESKYVSMIAMNPSGANDDAYGTMNLRINEIVLK